jgi:hypothetical protein
MRCFVMHYDRFMDKLKAWSKNQAFIQFKDKG